MVEIDFSLKNYDKAIKRLDKCVDISKLITKPLAQRGVAYYEKGCLKEAEQDFRKVLEMDPGHKKSLKYLNEIKSQKKNDDQGKEI